MTLSLPEPAVPVIHARAHEHPDQATPRPLPDTRPAEAEDTDRYVIAFAASTPNDGLYLGTPQVVTGWKAAVAAARRQLLENITVDLCDTEPEQEDGDPHEEAGQDFDRSVPVRPGGFEVHRSCDIGGVFEWRVEVLPLVTATPSSS